MRTTLLLLMALTVPVLATAQQGTHGTISLVKTNGQDSIITDSLITVVPEGRCIALQTTRFEVGMLRNPKKSEGVDPPIFSSNGLDFEQYISRYLKYPKLAMDSNIIGVVELDFMVDVAGFTRGIIVNKGIGFGCDKEALRVLRQMPKWTPAKVNGETVACRLTREISFEPKNK